MKKFKNPGLTMLFLVWLVLTVAGCYSSNQEVPTVARSDANWLGKDWIGTSSLSDGAIMDGWSTTSSTLISRCNITDGYFVFDTNLTGITGNFATTLGDVKKITIITKMKSSSTGVGICDFDLKLGGFRQRLQFSSGNKITMYDGSGSSNATSNAIDLTSLHTYMVTFEILTDDTGANTGIKTNVYVDGSITPVATGTSTTTYNGSTLAISDGGSGFYLGYLDWFYYTFDGAFTPNNVIFPDGVSL
jgi:hypothetical protein